MILVPELIIFGEAGKIKHNVALRLKGKFIADIDAVENLRVRYPEDDVLTFPECSLLPGLIDSHTHLGADGAESFLFESQDALLEAAVDRLEAALKNGVTTVRDVGSPDFAAPELKKLRENGKKIPRIFSSLTALASTGGHTDGSIFSKRIDGANCIQERVRELKILGADYIKVMDSEGYRGFEYSQEELNAAAKEAHAQKLKITAHAGSQPAVHMCVNAGFDTIEHGNFMTTEEAEILAERDGTLVPTMLAFKTLIDFLSKGGKYLKVKNDGYNEAALSMSRRNLKEWKKLGLRIACGTDMVLPYQTPHPVADEAAMLLTAGFTPDEAIEAATVKGAELLGKANELGRIQEGYLADILIVKGNPSINIDSLKSVVAVFSDGERII